MTKDQIAAAKGRAEAVVNGFKRVRDQNARDALALALHAERVEVLVAQLQTEIAMKKGENKAFDSFFDNVFGGGRGA